MISLVENTGAEGVFDGEEGDVAIVHHYSRV